MSVREFLSCWIKYLFSPLRRSWLCPLDPKTLVIKENVFTLMTTGNMATGEFTVNVELCLQAACEPRDSCTFWGTVHAAEYYYRKHWWFWVCSFFKWLHTLDIGAWHLFYPFLCIYLISIRIPGCYLIPQRKVSKAKCCKKRQMLCVSETLKQKAPKPEGLFFTPCVVLWTAEAMDPDKYYLLLQVLRFEKETFKGVFVLLMCQRNEHGWKWSGLQIQMLSCSSNSDAAFAFSM